MSDGAADLQAAERKIRDLLGQHSWRKARDEAKTLCKIDRGRYLPLLIEANVGLAREMLDKKLVSEARQVIAYLKTIAPCTAWEALETQAAVKAGDFSAAAAGALRALDHGETADARASAADRLVIAFQMPVGAEGISAAHAIAIQQALEAICAEQYERAAELIRPVPHDSSFRHWKLLIKGLAAFHTGEHERAARCLAGLPPDSVPGRAAVPYLHWLDHADGQELLAGLPDHAREHLAALAGCSASPRLILRAEELWKKGQPRQMYELLRSSLESFPSEDPDWVGTLTEFSLNCLMVLPPQEHDPYADFLHELLEFRRTRSERERKMLLRALSLDCALDPDADYLQSAWEQFLRLRARLDGADSRVTSIAYEWLGTILAGIDTAGQNSSPLSERAGGRMPDAKGAVRALRESVAADPENLKAQLTLALVYGRLRRKGDRNRLLDSMARRFPDNKQVLLLAADRCIERKAYVKGLALLNRALQQDRLDPNIPNGIVIASLLHAFELFRRGRLADARQALDDAEAMAVERPDDFMRCRWSLLQRRGVMEHLYGDEARTKEYLAQARNAAACLEAYLLMGHLVWRRYQSPGSGTDPFAAEFRALCKTQSAAARAPLLLRILDFWKGRPGAPSLKDATAMVREYIAASATRKFTRAEAVDLIERIPPWSAFSSVALIFLRAMLKQDRGDPLFRLYEFRYYDDPQRSVSSRRKKLDAIMKEAARRKEDRVIQEVQHEIEKLNQPPPTPFGPEFDLLENDDFEPEDDDYDDLFEDIGRDMNPREMREFAAMQEVLRNASDEELRELRRTLPKGTPPEIFDLMLDLARSRDSEPARGRSRPAQDRKPKKKPAQGEFFDL